jgi:hypothetical protein
MASVPPYDPGVLQEGGALALRQSHGPHAAAAAAPLPDEAGPGPEDSSAAGAAGLGCDARPEGGAAEIADPSHPTRKLDQVWVTGRLWRAGSPSQPAREESDSESADGRMLRKQSQAGSG